VKKSSLEVIDIRSWEGPFAAELQERAISALEEGKVLYFPGLAFELSEQEKNFLNPDKVDPRSKNISYDIRRDRLGHTTCNEQEAGALKTLLNRYACRSKSFLESLLPFYRSAIKQARTSLRPVEIEGRPSSIYKDDSRLHVDAFPSSPVKGDRILRLFTNVNPDQKDRVWRTGEPFEEVIRKMAPKVAAPLPGVARLLRFFKVTKGLRSPYDHYMLQIHDKMKADDDYQRTAPQETICFPPGSSWMVFTDLVSHAAMRGKDAFEQSWLLPLHGLRDKANSPLAKLERYFGKALVSR
jgi:hypothetical protein